MAIYHLSAKVISRTSGRSITAAAAYRAGDKITDERTGLTFDYSRKKDVDATLILKPENSPDWMGARSLLWNEVEKVERRKDSQLAREIDVALPVELNNTQKQELVKTFVTDQFVSQGMVADIAFHHLHSHNPHAHILLTMREITANGFGKKNRDWNRKELLEKYRSSWEAYTNRALERAGRNERIDRRTLEEQGINRIPQIHLGPNVAAMMARGIATERGNHYLSIQVANQEIDALERKINALEKTIAKRSQTNQEDHENKQNRASLAVATTAYELLNRFGEPMPDGTEVCEGNTYRFSRSLKDKSLTIEAKDGRGTILSWNQGKLSEELSQEDIQRFTKMAEELDKLSLSKSRSQQNELG